MCLTVSQSLTASVKASVFKPAVFYKVLRITKALRVAGDGTKGRARYKYTISSPHQNYVWKEGVNPPSPTNRPSPSALSIGEGIHTFLTETDAKKYQAGFHGACNSVCLVVPVTGKEENYVAAGQTAQYQNTVVLTQVTLEKAAMDDAIKAATKALKNYKIAPIK